MFLSGEEESYGEDSNSEINQLTSDKYDDFFDEKTDIYTSSITRYIAYIIDVYISILNIYAENIPEDWDQCQQMQKEKRGVSILSLL